VKASDGFILLPPRVTLCIQSPTSIGGNLFARADCEDVK
jgi:hypothetical protein